MRRADDPAGHVARLRHRKDAAWPPARGLLRHSRSWHQPPPWPMSRRPAWNYSADDPVPALPLRSQGTVRAANGARTSRSAWRRSGESPRSG